MAGPKLPNNMPLSETMTLYWEFLAVGRRDKEFPRT
jgi:hypothetical protein